MIENMKVEFGGTSDIDSWMRLVRKVSWNFPGLETEQSIEEHKIIVLKFMNDKRALCVKNEEDIVGVLLPGPDSGREHWPGEGGGEIRLPQGL